MGKIQSVVFFKGSINKAQFVKAYVGTVCRRLNVSWLFVTSTNVSVTVRMEEG